MLLHTHGYEKNVPECHCWVTTVDIPSIGMSLLKSKYLNVTVRNITVYNTVFT